MITLFLVQRWGLNQIWWFHIKRECLYLSLLRSCSYLEANDFLTKGGRSFMCFIITLYLQTVVVLDTKVCSWKLLLTAAYDPTHEIIFSCSEAVLHNNLNISRCKVQQFVFLRKLNPHHSCLHLLLHSTALFDLKRLVKGSYCCRLLQIASL